MAHVISAEEAVGIVGRLTGNALPPEPGDRASISAWRARFAQTAGPHELREAAWDGDCDTDSPHGTPGISLWLELVESCNLDCVFCYNPWRPAGSPHQDRLVLSPEQLRDTTDRIAARIPISHVTLSGGEPLLYPQIVPLTEHLRQHCDSIGMTTNGRGLTRNRLSALTTAGLTRISVPVHSHVPAVHDELAGRASWRSAVRALALTVEAGLSASMTCVVTRKNVDHVDVLADVAQQLGVGIIVLNCFHPTGQGARREDLGLSNRVFDELVDSLRAAAGDRIGILVGSPPQSVDGARRGRHISRLSVSPFGDLKLCNHSSAGILNVLHDPNTLDAFLTDLSTDTHVPYVSRVDACSCLTQQAKELTGTA
ncbi:radical SAM protein [Streptomyces specialis]|uniref:radical SAM protein n=1 Tax=Streptomyces specialis TaxID=498367 RepID=UPI00073E20FF|nr:radical SAM protein [Streptomyces specialis]